MVTELSLLACATGIDGEVRGEAWGGAPGTGSCGEGAGGCSGALPLCAL